MIKSIIFDMDGVLINSELISRKVEKKLYDKYNIPYNEALVKSLVGKRIENYWESIFDHYSIEPIAFNEEKSVNIMIMLSLKDNKEHLSLLAQENSIQIYDLGGDELSSIFE